jgi:AmmeMemoRadiSam system radical SAM enzyme/AmmeMemoRadiSam system protein B/AmmeMemoRadiSam system protein A
MNSKPWVRLPDGAVAGSWWQPGTKPGRLDCLLCPRQCSLAEGDKGFCFVRENRDGKVVLSTYGKSTGFCIDPIEKKPLNHFYPGTAVLSFGTAGCNLGCQFCQNWDISKSRQVERLSESAEPAAIAEAAKATSCRSVAFTYNDPVIWAEYAIDTAKECRNAGIKTVAVTAGYISSPAREEFFSWMDAANVDLKAFSEQFYSKITYSHLQPVLDSLKYLVRETNVWVEITNLIIPKLNDNPDELRRMCDWILQELGDFVPVHFTAFHPDFRMMDRERTDPQTLLAAFEIARQCGLKFPYVGNVHDVQHQSTRCPNCSAILIERDWYVLGQYNIEQSADGSAECKYCRTSIAGHYDKCQGNWGARRQPVRISDFSRSAIHLPTITSNQQPTSHKSDSSKLQTTSSHTVSEHSNPTLSAQESTSVSTVPPTPAVQPKPLKLDKINSSQRELCLRLAATSVATSVTGQPIKTPPETLTEFLQSIVMGAFVTLKRGDVLRGCCGVLGKPMAVGSAIGSAAIRTAREDQRMAPISASELHFLHLDVTLLGPLTKITTAAAERPSAVKIGKHGLMIQRGQNSGLLLPSVATERGWGAVEFLRAVCTKAQLPTDAWEREDSVVMTFDGESISADLKDYLPQDLTKQVSAPLTIDQVAAYAQVAGANIVAFAVGGTPSYVIPQLPDTTVNALVLTMQWGPPGAEASNPTEGASQGLHQGNAVQVSFRPGIPLQANLFQMCQHAGQMFAQQRFNGELKVGLTLGFDPAMHGYGESADLAGVDTAARAIILSDPRHCGFIHNPNQTAEQTLDVLRRNLPVGSRNGAVHTVSVVSTMPSTVCISMPGPTLVGGVRAPAVAGKFYPAEDAARRAAVESLLKGTSSDKKKVLAAMVPHAGLKYSGKLAAKVWRSIELDTERTIVIISPKHTGNGVNWAVCPQHAWGLSDTTRISGDYDLASTISQQVPSIQLDAGAHASEHGIEVQLPILEQVAPHSKVVGIAMHGGGWEDIQQAASQLAEVIRKMDQPPLLIISSDMNHYADDTETRRRDRLALDAFTSGDPKKLLDVCRENEISMCGVIPAALVMETLKQLGKQFHVEEVGYATSADVTTEKSSVVGYAGALLVE